LVKSDYPIGEATKYGWIILPDVCNGWGPLYFCKIIKKENDEENEDNREQINEDEIQIDDDENLIDDQNDGEENEISE